MSNDRADADDRGTMLNCGCYDTEHIIYGYCKRKLELYKRAIRRKIQQAKENKRDV